MANMTPMMRQYLEMKDKYPGMILFFRLGDFYEMFFDDAKLVSRELELTHLRADGRPGDSERPCKARRHPCGYAGHRDRAIHA